MINRKTGLSRYRRLKPVEAFSTDLTTTQAAAMWRSPGFLDSYGLEGCRVSRALTDALGTLGRVVLLPGNRSDTVGVAPLMDDLSFDAVLADKAFDSNWIVKEMNARGATICISQCPERKAPLAIDGAMRKWRHLVENSFCDPKDARRIALCTDQTDLNFAAFLNSK